MREVKSDFARGFLAGSEFRGLWDVVRDGSFRTGRGQDVCRTPEAKAALDRIVELFAQLARETTDAR